MNRPSSRTLFLAHPVVAVPVCLASLAGLYACCQGGSEGFWAGLAFLLMMGAVGNARSEVTKYRQWERDWAAMAGEALPPPRFKGCLGAALIGFLALLGLGAAVAHPDAFSNLVVTAVGLLAVLIAVGAWLRMRRHRSRSQRNVPVQLAAKATTPTPTLDAAYADLPEHLQQLMKRTVE